MGRQTEIARAKASIRGQGWKVSGNLRSGYTVSQLGLSYRFDVLQLLEFAGHPASA